MTSTSRAPGTASVSGPRLTPVRRGRVFVRRTLFRLLRTVPGSIVTTVHDRWISLAGERAAIWRPAASALFYRPIPHPHIVVPGGAGERIAVVGSRLERLLWWYGEAGYERGEATRWRRLCAVSDNVLEVGANIGYYTVVGGAATPGRYTAVDANPEAAAIVRRNVALNELPVEVLQAAVVGVGAPAQVELAFPDQETDSAAPLGSYLREGTESVSDRAASRSVLVPTAQAAALFAGRDLVKLDIEGSEAAVLTAAADEIRRSRPVLLVEVLSGSSRLRDVLGDLLRDGWRLHALDDAMTPLSHEELMRVGDRDVLLVPEERELPG